MPDPTGTTAPASHPARTINFGQLIELCFRDPKLFIQACTAIDVDSRAGLDLTLATKGVTLDAVESPLVSARIQAMSRDERELYVWMFTYTDPKAVIILPGGYSVAGSPVSWP